MNYPMDSLTPFHDALLSNTLWLTSKKTGFPLPAGNHLPGVFGWSGYSCLVIREGANKQVISSQADSLIKISRIWADFFPANTSNQPI